MAEILVLDDNEELLQTMELVLSGVGHLVWIARDGSEGQKLLSTQEFDLVVTDMYMPGRDGLEIIMQIRTHAADTGIIGISGGSNLSAECLDLAKRAGAHCTLAKPFSVEQLLAAVKAVLNRDASST